jgi:hypothetical protein
VLAVLVLTAVPAATLAQTSPAPASAPSPTEPPGYRAAIDEAVAEYAAGRYPEARALFMRAHTLQPSARTLRGLGMAEFELRNYVEATRLLQQALSSTVRALDGELRTATQALLARAQGFVGRYALALTPPELQLKVNSVPAAREPDGSLMLSIGDHALYAEAQGYVPISHTLRVNGGENTTLNITLERAPAPVAVAPVATPEQPVAPAPARVTPTSPTQPRDEDDSGSVFSSPWFWTVAAVVVIGAGVGVTLLVLSEEPGVEPTYGGSTKTVLVAP